MKIIFSLIGIVGSFFMIYFREPIGDMIGEGDWMRNIGGVYNVVVFIAIFIFFWGLASLTGTTELLFKPVMMLFPGFSQSNSSTDAPF